MAQRGVALLLLLVLVAVISLVSANAISVGALEARRDAEDELLFAGLAFQKALQSYVNASPGSAVLGPQNLEDLLRDPRFAGVRRHLRRIPADPMSGQWEWGLMRSSDGQIVGVYSLATGKPIRRAGFEPPLEHFNDATTYRAWIFGPALPIGSPRASQGVPPR